MTDEEMKAFERRAALRRLEEEAKKEKQKEGAREKLTSEEKAAFETAKAFLRVACDITSRFVRGAARILAPLARAVAKVSPPLARASISFGKNAYLLLATKKDEKGERHFNLKRLARNAVLSVAGFYASGALLLGLYYYGTLATYENVYIPNAGVFINQQFVEPSKPGSFTAPRDEVYTVLGKHKDEENEIEPIRFDIDYNGFFFWSNDAMRPDMAAAKLDSQSPYGIKATVRATGFYTRLPRFLRINAMKWLDLRPEIVVVDKVEELKEMPEIFKKGDPLPEVSTPLSRAHRHSQEASAPKAE